MKKIRRIQNVILCLAGVIALGSVSACTVPKKVEITKQQTEHIEDTEHTEHTETFGDEAPETTEAVTEKEPVTESAETEEAGEIYDSTMPVIDLPAKYDFREEGRISHIRNQGNIGTCWAFASCMALETRLLPGLAASFSEDHMSIHNSFGYSQNEGGEYTMAMAYLLAWQGPVSDEDDPYGDGYSPDSLEPVLHVQEINILPADDIDAIKTAVYMYGGVQSSLYTAMAAGQVDRDSYNAESGAYYYNGVETANHDVVIIGWDDDYSDENFRKLPPGKGAFICANSWGYEFGEEGCFYVSYYDANIGKNNVLYRGIEGTDNYDRIYQTDLCGWVGQMGYNQEDAWFANVFAADGDQMLEAAGFYATDKDTDFEIYVCRNVGENPHFTNKTKVMSGHLQYAGFYTIPFLEGIEIDEGERFAVIVKIRTPGSIHPVAVEYDAPERELEPDLGDGEGYVSYRGVNWERSETGAGCNVCLKAYTSNRR